MLAEPGLDEVHFGMCAAVSCGAIPGANENPPLGVHEGRSDCRISLRLMTELSEQLPYGQVLRGEGVAFSVGDKCRECLHGTMKSGKTCFPLDRAQDLESFGGHLDHALTGGAQRAIREDPVSKQAACLIRIFPPDPANENGDRGPMGRTRGTLGKVKHSLMDKGGPHSEATRSKAADVFLIGIGIEQALELSLGIGSLHDQHPLGVGLGVDPAWIGNQVRMDLDHFS